MGKEIVLLVITFMMEVNGQHTYDYNFNAKQYTRKIVLKQGTLQGVIAEPRVNRDLPPVEQYFGIPYAAAPVGELRFMPPGSAPPWYGVKFADSFGSVCPQRFPDTKNMAPYRKEYFKRIVQFLSNQQEDCLYLNIYAPVQDSARVKYPVIVFLHGESFEWNSGNPYDGSVLAAYGKVVFVTLNFRLGILGFLKVGLKDTAKSNFGLVDQVAALLWVKENIAAFGGDPGSVTLLGHGTGAVSASLLMLSPMVEQDGNKLLFHRAILMSGSSLSDWALASRTSKQVTYQIADFLNCQMDDDAFANCLRKKRLSEIMSATATTGKYWTKFGPLVDGLIVPNDPAHLMANYTNLLHRFVLLSGLTEVESINLLDAVALTHGMLEKERDQDLNKYLGIRCELNHEVCLLRTLAEYLGKDFVTSDQSQGGLATRDMLLDMLSDARTAAPMVLTARYHATVNPQSYFYVFGHTTASRNFIYNKTIHGDELPYVLGIPLDGPKFHFVDHYSEHEKLLSEVVMTYWSNFAHTGNPNIPTKHGYLSLRPSQWQDFDVEWPEFELEHETYLYIDTPPTIKYHYRSKEVQFWSKTIPEIAQNHTIDFNTVRYLKPTQIPYAKNVPPFIYPKPISKSAVEKGLFGGGKFKPSPSVETSKDVYGIVHYKPDDDEPPRDKMLDNLEYGKVITREPEVKSGMAMNVLIAVGGVFLLVNLILFAGLYYKCIRLKSVESSRKRTCDEPEVSEASSAKMCKSELQGCNLMKMISKSSKSEDTYEAVKTSEGSSKTKLTRQMSASTIDPHTKVRDWIANEIVHKYSPRIFRRSKRPFILTRQFSTQKEENSKQTANDPKIFESNSTLGRSPTRPVSPVEDNTKTVHFKSLKKKPEKVSVAVDATPSGRGPSVLMQQPIELTKSLDYPYFHPGGFEGSSLRRSATLDNFFNSSRKSQSLRRSSTSINLEVQPIETIKIEHHHSRSDPVQDLYQALNERPKTLKTFSQDVNVTSRDDDEEEIKPLSPEESLMTIKRRKFPKVLPDFPTSESKQSLAHKRRSMPAPSVLYRPINEFMSASQPNSPSGKIYARFRPLPPPRTSSTLGRKTSISQSPALLASEPPTPSEPELTCNNLYVGPLIPHAGKLNTQPIYDNLRAPKDPEPKDKGPKTIITADPNHPIKRVEPKIIIKPTMARTASDPHKNNKPITRVCVNDNLPVTNKVGDELIGSCKKEVDVLVIKSSGDDENKMDSEEDAAERASNKTVGTLKNSNVSLNKESSSSESSPSEESDTGTVVKRV